MLPDSSFSHDFWCLTHEYSILIPSIFQRIFPFSHGSSPTFPWFSHEFPVRFRLHALHHHPFAPYGLHDRHGEAAPSTSFGATGAGCGGGADQVKRWIDDLYKKRIWDFTWFGYGSIPINTIFRGMNIHLPAILMFTRGTRFWHTAIWDFTWFHMSSPIFSELCLVENMGLTGLIWRFEEEIMQWGTLIRAYFNHQKRSWS